MLLTGIKLSPGYYLLFDVLNYQFYVIKKAKNRLLFFFISTSISTNSGDEAT